MADRCQIMLIGESGMGKTCFCSKLPHVFFASTEPGTKWARISREQQRDLRTFEAFESLVDKMCASTKYQWLVIDTLDMLFELAADKVCRDMGWDDIGDGAMGAGYGKVARLIRKQAFKLYYKGSVNVIWVGHTKIEEVPDTDAKDDGSGKKRRRTKKIIKAAMPNSLYQALGRFVDFTLYHGVRHTPKGKVRSLHFGTTQNIGDIEVKDRSGTLPDYMDTCPYGDNSDVKKFLRLLAQAKPSAEDTEAE